MATLTAKSYTAASGDFVRAGRAAGIVLDDDFERSCSDPALWSVSGTGAAAVIDSTPRAQQSQFHSGDRRWVEFLLRCRGMRGYKGKFRVNRLNANVTNGSDWPWSGSRRPMRSLDLGYTWGYFQNCTINTTGSGYAEFWDDAPFSVDTVLVSRSRIVSVHHAGEWLENLAARFPGFVTPTTSALAYAPTVNMKSFAGQAFIANEYLPQVDLRGRTIPAMPLYAARINNPFLTPAGGGAKRLAILSAGVHAGEDLGDWVMRGFLSRLLGNSPDAIELMREFDFLLYPLVNAPGRAGGGYRGLWTVYGGRDDFNRNMDTNGLMEPVDKFKAAITSDRAGRIPTFSIDFHGTGQYRWGFVQDAGEPLHTVFNDQQEANFGSIINDEADTLAGHVAGYMRSLGTQLHLTLEVGDISPILDSELVSWNTALAKTLRYYLTNRLFV